MSIYSFHRERSYNSFAKILKLVHSGGSRYRRLSLSNFVFKATILYLHKKLLKFVSFDSFVITFKEIVHLRQLVFTFAFIIILLI